MCLSHGLRWRGLLLAGSYLAYFLALLSKPIAVILPVTLLLWELVMHRRRPQRWSWTTLEPTFCRLVPYAGVSLFYLAVRTMVGASSVSALTGTLSGQNGTGFWAGHYLLQTKPLMFYYLRLAVWPFGQKVDPEFARVNRGEIQRRWAP